jgi:hypothetical protein
MYYKSLKHKRHFKRLNKVCGSYFSQHVKYILFTLEENALPWSSKLAGPSKELNPHQSGHPTGTPHRHHRKEEDPHLHTIEICKNKV